MTPSTTIITHLEAKRKQLSALTGLPGFADDRKQIIDEIYTLAGELFEAVKYERLITELKGSEIL